jgi:serine/threonine protein kinase
MADSLFDNRYRYDHIYPRGRSGETLRAHDTQQNDLPVVVKRPALNDAPPIRAGQEVSILNERKALLQLKGHPVLTELLATGQFFVGGSPHQYIVIERADGTIIADEVTARSRKDERLPQLEMLVIIDLLLDLLQAAHEKEIVYNDVDAKHLFWSRDNYRLKVIDWGNAVFLEGDTVTPQGISRQNDIDQVGQLLYFILTGGNRADIPRDADAEFLLNFGKDAEHITPRLQEIISKATHPNTRFRYRTIADLRRDLDTLRRPLERERDIVVNHVTDRLRRNLSKNDLRELSGAMEPALQVDPGYPDACVAQQEIYNRLRDLDVSADLDAVRIYMDGGNWARSADLLNELRSKTGTQTANLVNLLLDFSMRLLDSNLTPTPPAVTESLTMIFEEQFAPAARVLLVQQASDQPARNLQWMLAERISARIPGLLLLRPNLYRLDLAVRSLANEGINIHDGQYLLNQVHKQVEVISRKSAIDLGDLSADYQVIVGQLDTLNNLLVTVSEQYKISPRKLPLTSLERALSAAMELADNMHIISKQAANSPRDATIALDASRAIEPNSHLWESLAEFLNTLYQHLQTYQTYVPAADGTDLAAWLTAARKEIAPFVECLDDATLYKMNNGLETAAQSWSDYADTVVMGNRAAAIDHLTQATQSAHLISPSLAGWLKQLRTVITGASTLERHAISGGYGRALADGWDSFDRGRLTEAERLAQQAVEISRNETERFAAKRLLTLSTTARQWIERNGILDATRSHATLNTLEALYQKEESTTRDAFATQMPGKDTYLKAMNKGLIDVYAQESAPAIRIFFFHAVLLGALETHDGNLEDARFWREVAVLALGDYGQRHVATRALEDFISRRRDVNTAEALFNQMVGVEALKRLEKTRKKIEENPRAKLLSGGIRSLRQLENALRDWADGEFRAAGLKLEDAIKGVADAEKTAVMDISPYRAWLVEVQAAAAELHTANRQMRQIIERRPADPSEIVRESHLRLAETTRHILGEDHAAQLVRWHETYEEFLAAYTAKGVRRSAKLEKLDDLFKEMFIDRHPAYPLYRHWTDLTDRAPEFPAPPTNEPTPRIADDEIIEPEQYLGSRYADAEATTQQAPITGVKLPSLRNIILLIAIIFIASLLFVAYTILNDPGADGDNENVIDGVAVTLVDTPTQGVESSDAAPMPTQDSAVSADRASATAASISVLTPTLVTPSITPSQMPTDVPTEGSPVATDTPLLPTESPTETATETPIPSDTPTPTITPSPTTTPTPTLPASGLQGWQDLLALTERMDTLPWNEEHFRRVPDSNWHLGLGQRLPGDEAEQILITLPPETLDLFLGNDAPSRIRRTEATLGLITYDPTLDTEEITFGLMFQSSQDETLKAGVILQVVNLNAVNFWLVQGEEHTFISQRSVNSITGRVRLERDAINGTVTAFFENAQIGDPIPFTEAETPIQPVLFARNGGVEVTVVNWRVGLR